MATNLSFSIHHYLSRYVQAQLVVTVISLPMLIAWGLPLSIMSLIGNLIFAPFLTAFLLLSSLIFFTELLLIPNIWLISLLEVVNRLWSYCLSFGSKSWLVGFKAPPFLVLFLLPLTLLIVLSYLKRYQSTIHISLLIVVLTLTTLTFHFNPLAFSQTTSIPLSEKITIEKTQNGTLRIIDQGHFNRKKNSENAVNFELKPHLYKTYGTTDIEEFIILNPGSGSFKVARELTKTCKVKCIKLPYFEKKISKYAWRCYFELREHLAQEKIPFIRKQSYST